MAMAMGIAKTGKCSNFGNCSVADGRSTVEVASGMDFVCTECGKPLLLTGGASDAGKSRLPIYIMAGLVLATLVAGGVAWFKPDKTPPPAANVAVAPPAATLPAPPPPPGAGSPVLRFAGSNTLGSKLVPALAEAWLKSEGANAVQRLAGGTPSELSLQAKMADGSTRTVVLAAHGTGTGFEGLASGSADIAMASRPVTPAETTGLARLGDMTRPASEHVLGLDGIAVIVHSGNPVSTLSKPQLMGIFSGQTTDWSQLGASARGKSGPITLYARDANSGTFDSFQTMVLGAGKLPDSAKRFEDSAQLSDAVAGDPTGIGFIGLPYVRNAKALALAEKGASALLPNRFTVATEDYVLSRRLYLYSAAAPGNPAVSRFLGFAKGRAGQDVVAANGFVEQTVQAQDKSVAAPGTDAPAAYRQAIANADRLSLNFRFRSGSKELDTKAIPDLERVLTFITDVKTPPSNIVLLGFADARGAADANVKLSIERAAAVADEFKLRGVTPGVVTGFGAAMPVADNATAQGQEKNRRVEIWVKR